MLTCCSPRARPPRPLFRPHSFICAPQFQSFTDRINAIDIDVAHRIREVEVSPSDENDSFFNEALNRWRELVRALFEPLPLYSNRAFVLHATFRLRVTRLFPVRPPLNL